ncbi:uncharacterized protein LOC113345407 isoform X2 [Papaver somniferum]|uniref:uncharacterized protein LOC113345407 isoform X2 n=1 Tax=Papaver somniferum TaxID=3469 RepID=UPI000E700BAE|nr:uncharacterized protein LOC113345407 isoform X2 [Papaver somniferum]
MEDTGINHRMVDVNGINMHIAEKGQGPVVLLVHGFPSLWYSWRHQILSLAASGYKAVAPDLRGYGDTDAPISPQTYTCFHIVDDLVALIDILGQDKVFVVGHDWGAVMSWYLCLFRPDKVKALVNLSVAFTPRFPFVRPLTVLRAIYGDEYYMLRFQPGEMEAEFARVGTETVLRKFLSYHTPAPLKIPRDKGFAPEGQPTLPSWLSEEDIQYYTSRYEKSGFTGGFNYYRNINVNWELTAQWTGAQVKVPVKFMVGDQDLCYHMVGMKAYIHSGLMKRDVPFLQEVVVLKGVGHFIMEERADEISGHMIINNGEVTVSVSVSSSSSSLANQSK